MLQFRNSCWSRPWNFSFEWKFGIETFNCEGSCKKIIEAEIRSLAIEKLRLFRKWVKGKKEDIKRKKYSRDMVRTRMLVVAERTWPSWLTTMPKGTSRSSYKVISSYSSSCVRDERYGKRRTSTAERWRFLIISNCQCKPQPKPVAIFRPYFNMEGKPSTHRMRF